MKRLIGIMVVGLIPIVSVLADSNAVPTAVGVRQVSISGGPDQPFWSRTEHMGRCPDRFDYLLDAIAGLEYARTATNAAFRTNAEFKAAQLVAVWDHARTNAAWRKNDYWGRHPDVAAHMTNALRTILKEDPAHPYKERIQEGIKELERVHEGNTGTTTGGTIRR